MSVIVPPIKTHGIKTKILPWILSHVPSDYEVYYEPFMGSGVVGFNIKPAHAVFADTNRHVIAFYEALKYGDIEPDGVRDFLEREGEKLRDSDGSYYYEVRERFNESWSPMDFLFLVRSCFNGVMRFNKSGKFNVPFCKNPKRFSIAYITKIVNQVKSVFELIHDHDWKFLCQGFSDTLIEPCRLDLVYCDPPYLGRNTGYYDGWTLEEEQCLFESLSKGKYKFMLSTWSDRGHQHNEHIDKWHKFRIEQYTHFYRVGPKPENRYTIQEALVLNF